MLRIIVKNLCDEPIHLASRTHGAAGLHPDEIKTIGPKEGVELEADEFYVSSDAVTEPFPVGDGQETPPNDPFPGQNMPTDAAGDMPATTSENENATQQE